MKAALDYVRVLMGQSKITVFRKLFDGDEAAAQHANNRFEAAYWRGSTPGESARRPARPRHSLRCARSGCTSASRRASCPPLAIASSACSGWGDLVDLAISPSDVGRGRPSPDMILAAVVRLEIDDVHAVAIAGDTVSDLLAGTRAGAGIVAGVLTGADDRATLETAPHTHILDSIADLPAVLRR